MRPFILFAALSTLVSAQLTQDSFDAIVGNVANQAGIPQCGVSCLLEAFKYSKLSRSCFVTSNSLSCLCDNDDIVNGALTCASSPRCGSTNSETFAEKIGEICAARKSGIEGGQTSLMAASSSAEVLSAKTSDGTTMGLAATTATMTPRATITQEVDLNGEDLTTSAKAGIGAGAGVLGLVVLLAAFILLRRRKRRAAAQPLDVLSPGYQKGEQAELMGSPTPTDAGSKFTMSPMSEMGGGVFRSNEKGQGNRNGTASELGGNEPVELPASHTYGDMRQTAADISTSNDRRADGRPKSGPLMSASELYLSSQARSPQ